MKTILVPVISLLLSIALTWIEGVAFNVPTDDWRIWGANTAFAVLLALGITHAYEAWRYRAINGIPR